MDTDCTVDGGLLPWSVTGEHGLGKMPPSSSACLTVTE